MESKSASAISRIASLTGPDKGAALTGDSITIASDTTDRAAPPWQQTTNTARVKFQLRFQPARTLLPKAEGPRSLSANACLTVRDPLRKSVVEIQKPHKMRGLPAIKFDYLMVSEHQQVTNAL